MPESLPLTTKTLLAELRELALAQAVSEEQPLPKGSIVEKTIKGCRYAYYQFRDIASQRYRQYYLGPAESEEVETIRSRLNATEELTTTDIARIAAACRSAGALTVESSVFRVIEAFAQAGVFQQRRAILIGTHAFNALGNLLGVRWDTGMQTMDIDLASPSNIALAAGPSEPPDSILENLRMGFIPVPQLDPRTPSTSFQVRGRQLRVDLLTPMTGKPQSPVFVPALNASAEAVRFLDYLIESPVIVPLLGPSRMALVSVPSPERLAIHKLLVSQSRPSAMAAKAEKDRRQAAQLIQVLAEEAPDALTEALGAALEQGPKWRKRLHNAHAKLETEHSDAALKLQELWDE
ncbi:hypothetical protein DES49_1252 [Halospina denitrificans]|uniref:Nucleotidyltransferase-like domain-containing protein n=1 Tax=Halospina denitrificans TaxID=332522 RepID=A0A4V3ER47_9GAMM|nr:nucleotidyltransferase domain-containing protein [Halospina denitrificans]TDT43438.1 hypothetical protein DES49_1252 [Halospina denitrificans]